MPSTQLTHASYKTGATGIYPETAWYSLRPVGRRKVVFGLAHTQILKAFEFIDEGKIPESVKSLADHEQRNILQPVIYDDAHLVMLLRSNQISYITDFPSGAAQAIELTLSSQCERVYDGRTIGFSDKALADLSNIDQRMEFVLRAANKFDSLLHDKNRQILNQSINEIAAAWPLER